MPPPEPPKPSPCDDLPPGATVHWNPDVRAKLSLPTKILGGTLQARDAEKVSYRLSRFSDRWEDLRERTCREHHDDKTIGREEHDGRMACLDRSLAKQFLIVERLVEGETNVYAELDEIEADLESCLPEGEVFDDAWEDIVEDAGVPIPSEDIIDEDAGIRLNPFGDQGDGTDTSAASSTEPQS